MSSVNLNKLSQEELNKILKEEYEKNEKLKQEKKDRTIQLIKKLKKNENLSQPKSKTKPKSKPKPKPKSKSKPKSKQKIKTFDEYFQECTKNKTIPKDTPHYLKKALERGMKEYDKGLEYSYCIRAIGSERALFFYDARLKIIMHSCPGCCPAGSIFAHL